MNGIVGEIRLFSGNFTPRNWTRCEGQLIGISQSENLFNIIGTLYGGDGTTTFAVPDLRGRVVVGTGENPKVGINLGISETTGASETQLTLSQIPTASSSGTFVNRILKLSKNGEKPQEPTPVSLVQPSIGLHYIICVEGIVPQSN